MKGLSVRRLEDTMRYNDVPDCRLEEPIYIDWDAKAEEGAIRGDQEYDAYVEDRGQ